MGRGRCTGGQSPAEPLGWEASHQVEEKGCFLGEFALQNCLCFCERGRGNFPEGHVLPFCFWNACATGDKAALTME